MHQYSNQPEVVKRSVDNSLRTLAGGSYLMLAVSFSAGFRTEGLVVALSVPGTRRDLPADEVVRHLT